jgi:homocysteine S-methyltransferase
VGASAAGLRNLLIVTGDPPRLGPYPDSTAVFDIDSIGLTNVVYRLNHGLDPGGNPLGDPTEYVIGVAANQAAADIERELSRLHWKIDAGADFIVTQPVFDAERLERFLERAKPSIPVIAGLWPITSLRNAEFFANEVPGASLPDSVMQRIAAADAQGGDAAAKEGITIAREIQTQIRGFVQGVQISAPLDRIESAIGVLL